MSSQILFIVEGEKTEKKVISSLTKYFVNENVNITTAYCKDIYQLFKEIEDDPYLDTFLLIKSIAQNSEILKEFNSSDFSQIYMFFDFDGQDDQAEDQKIEEIIQFFSEETETGKIFLSYPMVESIKHFPKDIDFKDLTVPARINIGYKNKVDSEIDEKFKDFTNYSRIIWQILIEVHLRKLNFIVEGNYAIPSRVILQDEIFKNQKNKYLDLDSTIAVLSAFPVFLLEYYGVKFIRSLTS